METAIEIEQQLIKNRYKELFNSKPSSSYRSTLQIAEKRLVTQKPNIMVSSDLFYCLFVNPEIAAELALASYETNKALEKAYSTKDPKNVLEYVFFVGLLNGKLRVGKAMKEAGGDTPDVEVAQISGLQDILFFHTHPDLGDSLKPSVYSEDGKGDLYVFTRIRDIRNEALAEGKTPEYIEKPLMVIMQSDEKGTEKLMFVMEGEEISHLDREGYLSNLLKHKSQIDSGKSEDEAVEALRQAGYRASWIEVDLANYPALGLDHLRKLVRELGIV